MSNITVFSTSAETNLIATLADKSDQAIATLADKSDKAIATLADKSDKAIDAVTDVMKEAGKNFGGVTKELKDILFIVKCAIGVSVIGAGLYGINWAWRR
jgi:ABC-type transporter Mla subunit MlaD